MKNKVANSALRIGFVKSFDAAMKGKDYKPSLVEKVFRTTSADFQTYNNAGVFLGRAMADNIKRAMRRDELREFICKEMKYPDIKRKLPDRAR